MLFRSLCRGARLHGLCAHAVQAIRKRLAHKNPNVELLALGVSGRGMRQWRVLA